MNGDKKRRARKLAEHHRRYGCLRHSLAIFGEEKRLSIVLFFIVVRKPPTPPSNTGALLRWRL